MKKLFIVFALMVLVLSACGDDVEVINSIGEGKFVAVNISTRDTTYISGTINSSTGGIQAEEGDVVKIWFEPKDDYKKYHFNVNYMLPNGTKLPLVSDYTTEYSIPKGQEDVKISLSASYIEKAENTDISIVAFGSLMIGIK